MLQASNQVPPTPVLNTSTPATAVVNPMPINDNNARAQPKPLMVQSHGKQCYKCNLHNN